MKDCLGNELHIGDKVICSDMNYADLLIGEIVGFTPQKARIKYVRSEVQRSAPRECLKESYQIYRRSDTATDLSRKVDFNIYDHVFIVDRFDVKNNRSQTSDYSDQIEDRIRECFITQIGIVNKSDNNHLYHIQPVVVTPEEESDPGFCFWEKSWYAKELYKSKSDAKKALEAKNAL